MKRREEGTLKRSGVTEKWQVGTCNKFGKHQDFLIVHVELLIFLLLHIAAEHSADQSLWKSGFFSFNPMWVT